MINVLHITANIAESGGIREILRLLSARLDKRLFRMGICSITEKTSEIPAEFRDLGIDLFGLGRTGYFFDLLTTTEARKVINGFEADIVHTHHNKGNLHGRLAAVIPPRVALATTHHDMGDLTLSREPKAQHNRNPELTDFYSTNDPDWLARTLYPYLNIQLNRLNDLVISVSAAVRAIYASGPDDPRHVVVHSPYDESLFRKSYHGFTGDRVTLGTVGRLYNPKGHKYLVEAMKVLSASHGNIHLKIIGEGELGQSLGSLIHKHGLNHCVQLCGNLPHNTDLYQGLDIYVQPSVSEGCGISVLEAMGTGVPVIASDIDGIRELINTGESGILVPPKDPVALAQAIDYLITNRDKALELGEAGQKRACENFSAKVFIDAMSRIYKAMVEGQAS